MELTRAIIKKGYPHHDPLFVEGRFRVDGQAFWDMAGKRLDRIIQGENRPLILLGFDHPEQFKGTPVGEALKLPQTRYLYLPCPWEKIKNFFSWIPDIIPPEEDQWPHLKNFMVHRVRMFHHQWENIHISLNSNANRAKKKLKISPLGIRPISSEAVARIQKGNQAVSPHIQILNLDREGRLSDLRAEVIQELIRLKGETLNNTKIISATLDCATRIETILQILNRVKDKT